MAFVFRSSRFSSSGSGTSDASTSSHVGPGSYNLCQSRPISSSLAPFNSTSVRPLNSADTSSWSCAPGPGSYLPVSLQRPTARASSMAFRSRTRRFEDAASLAHSQIPGPGSYSGHRGWDDGRWARVARSQSTADHRRRKPNMHRLRASKAPSIPVRSQSHGYHANEKGEMESRKPVDHGHTGTKGDTVGPQAYNIDDRALTISKSCSFGRSRTKRQVFKPSSVPGPGNYDIAAPSITARHGAAWVAFASSVKRFSDDKKKDSGPAPGDYWGEGDERQTSRRLPHSKQAFSRSVGRNNDRTMKTVSSETPGPGSFDLSTDTPFKSSDFIRQRQAALGINLRPPFGHTEKRFREHDESTPGPGAFNVAVSIGDQKSSQSISSGGAFGSSQARFQTTNTERNNSNTPGPFSYEPEQVPREPRYRAASQSHMFRSQTRRFNVGNQRSSTPAPNSYSLAPQWGKVQAPLAKNNVFISSQRRFSHSSAQASDTPGPGAFNLSRDTPFKSPAQVKQQTRSRGIRTTAPFNSSNPRFHNASSETPGPGSFDLCQSDSMLKRSFNITIGDEYEIY